MSDVRDAELHLLSSQLPDSEPVSRPALIDTHSAGAMLARARQDKDWTVQQVADQLKLSPKQIVALEGDKFGELPKMVIVRGFVRTYAKLLKIDADPLVALLPKSVQDTELQAALKPALSTPFLESRLSLMGRQDSNKKYLFGAALLAVFSVGFFIIQKTDLIDSIKNSVDRNAISGNEATSASNFVVPTILDVSASKLVDKESSLAASSTSITALSENTQPVNEKNIELTTVASGASLAAETKKEIKNLSGNLPAINSVNSSLSASDKDVMRLKFRQDSWIQIKKENGVIVTSHLARAGTEETFSVKEALQVRIGNAAGVEGVLRDAPLVIPADTGSNVVNLNVK